MNVDTQFQHALPVAAPTRSVHDQPDQASARPVERPHHDEGADNQTPRQAARSAVQQEPHHAPRHGQGGSASQPPAAAGPQSGEAVRVGELLDVIV